MNLKKLFKEFLFIFPHVYGPWELTRYNPAHNFSTYHRICKICGCNECKTVKGYPESNYHGNLY